MAQCLVNPLFLYLAVWFVATSLYIAGMELGLFPRDIPQVLWIVLLNVGTFTLGYMTWNVFGSLIPKRDPLSVPIGRTLTEERFKRSLRITLLCGIITFVLCGARLFMVSQNSGIGLLQLVSDPDMLRLHLVAYVGGGMHETRVSTMAISITSSMTSLGFVLVGLLLYVGRRKRRYFYLFAFLFLSLAGAVLNLSRKGFVVDLLFLMLSYLSIHCLYRQKKTSEVLHDLSVPLAAVAVLFILIEILLNKSQLLGPRNRILGFAFSIYWYISAPLAAFGEFLAHRHEDYLMGQSLFLPLWKWLSRLDLVPPSSIALYGDKVYIPHMVNVYSYLRNIYEDFGMFGVAIVPYVLGWLGSALRSKASLFLPYLNIYLILLVLIIFSFYNYLLLSNQFYLQAFFGLVFFRYRLTDLEHIEM